MNKEEKIKEKLIKPKTEFLNSDACRKTPECLKLIYEKIFSEITSFLQNKYENFKNITFDIAKYNNKIAQFILTAKNKNDKKQIKFKIIFDDLDVKLYLDDNKNSNMTSQIYGVNFHREEQKVTRIKIDLISIKNKICKFIQSFS